MHSRIFQVSMEPIDKDDYIEESNYYDHWFTNSVADYVSDSEYRDEDLKWIEDCYDTRGIKFGVDNNGEYLIVEDKRKYFENSFNKFMKAISKIQNCTIDDFANGISEMWQLKDSYEEKFGFYVDADGELMTFDYFMRNCAVNEKYYLGGTVDYHA